MFDEILDEEDEIAAEREAEAARLGAQILGLPIRELPTLRDPVCVVLDAPLREAVQRMSEGGPVVWHLHGTRRAHQGGG